MQNNHLKNVSGLLLATLFISTSGVLGKYIAMPIIAIICIRSIIASSILFGFCKYQKNDIPLKSTKDYVGFVVSAIFMIGHWYLYFMALKLSNVAIGMLSIFTYPMITTLLEPIFTKKKLDIIHVVLAILVMLGIFIIAPEFSLESTYTKGILCGVTSAFCYAIRILILKQYTTTYDGSLIMFYQTAIVAAFSIPFLFVVDISNFNSQLPYLLILGIVTTAVGHTLLVKSLRYFAVSTASIITGIQPVFGILIAFIFVGETPAMNTYLGGSLILLTVVVESLRSKK